MIEKYCIGGLRHIDKEQARKIAEHFGLIATGDIPDGALKQIKSEWYNKGLRDGGDNVRKEMRQIIGLDL